jgi:hypothetical protein
MVFMFRGRNGVAVPAVAGVLLLLASNASPGGVSDARTVWRAS